MARRLAEADPDFRREFEKYEALERESQRLIDSRTKTDSQLRENNGVLAELEAMKEGETVYRLMGPVLAKQEHSEAVSHVKERISRLTDNLSRLDKKIEDMETEREKQQEATVKAQKRAIERLSGGAGAGGRSA